MKYAIYEGNIERLEKKLATIAKKCSQYGCEFRYERIGEEFREVKDDDGVVSTARFIIVEAEGVAKVNGWRFLATLEHTEKGNIISSVDFTIEVPDRYYNCKPICEHCNTNRPRRDTYIIYNDESGEFKQVGRSCLKDFTGGMSAEAVARYISYFDELIQAEIPSGGSGYYERYFQVEEMARYFAETIRLFGFVRSQDHERSTASRAYNYYRVSHGMEKDRKLRAAYLTEMEAVGFNPDSEEAKEETAAALAWVANHEANDNYMHNLKVVCSSKYINYGAFGILAALFPTFRRELEREAERKERERQEAMKAAASNYIGEVGQRITVAAKSARCVSSWETQYGYTFLYEFIDDQGNVAMWFASRSVDIDKAPFKVVGTVKEHSEYRGIKQTILTRCRIA